MWLWEQLTGKIYHEADGDFVCAGSGYAGSPEGKNNPDLQNVEGVGPLPCNRYTIQAPHDSPHTGKYTMDLEPDADGEMFGRSEFRIHGDSVQHPGAASHGCIVLPHPVRVSIWDSGDHRLQVVRELAHAQS